MIHMGNITLYWQYWHWIHALSYLRINHLLHFFLSFLIISILQYRSISTCKFVIGKGLCVTLWNTVIRGLFFFHSDENLWMFHIIYLHLIRDVKQFRRLISIRKRPHKYNVLSLTLYVFHGNHKNVCIIYIIPHWYDTGSWNTSLCKTRT